MSYSVICIIYKICVCVCVQLWGGGGKDGRKLRLGLSLSKSMKTTTTTTTTVLLLLLLHPRIREHIYSVYRSYLCYSSQGHVRCRQYFRRSDDDFIPFGARTRAHTTHTHTHAGKSVRVCRCVRTPCILF